MKARGAQTIHKNPYNLKNLNYAQVTILTGTQRVHNAHNACYEENISIARVNHNRWK
jgi:hypothetical protein